MVQADGVTNLMNQCIANIVAFDVPTEPDFPVLFGVQAYQCLVDGAHTVFFVGCEGDVSECSLPWLTLRPKDYVRISGISNLME